jgi:hypothetical protein
MFLIPLQPDDALVHFCRTDVLLAGKNSTHTLFTLLMYLECAAHLSTEVFHGLLSPSSQMPQ